MGVFDHGYRYYRRKSAASRPRPAPYGDIRHRIHELESRFPGALTRADRGELQRLRELLRMGGAPVIRIICVAIIVALTVVWAVALGAGAFILVEFILTGGGNSSPSCHRP
jgi:hypothetical protein